MGALIPASYPHQFKWQAEIYNVSETQFHNAPERASDWSSCRHMVKSAVAEGKGVGSEGS